MAIETRPVPGSPVRPPRLRSPLARAVVPVLGGIAVIGLIFLFTWLVALRVDQPTVLAPPTFSVGSAERRAASIAEDGPILLPGLNTTSGKHTVVLDHTGDDWRSGWRLYWAYPDDRDETCLVTQVRGTAQFDDCDGRRIDVTELAGAEGATPSVDDASLTIDLREAIRLQGSAG